MLRPKATEQVHRKNILQDPDPGKNFPQTSWHKAFYKIRCKAWILTNTSG